VFGADEPNYATMKDGKNLIAELGQLRPAADPLFDLFGSRTEARNHRSVRGPGDWHCATACLSSAEAAAGEFPGPPDRGLF
jgi:hypothetical protein